MKFKMGKVNKKNRGVPLRRRRQQYYCTRTNDGLSSTKIARIAEKLAFMIVFDGLPFETVQKFGFIQFCKELAGPSFLPPSPDTIGRIVKDLSNRARVALSDTLKGKDVIITSDLATVLHNTRGFLVVSASYVDETNQELRSFTLSAHETHDRRHTALNIAEDVKNILTMFSIDVSQVVGATTDGGANMVAAMRELLEPTASQLTCFLHFLHNLVMRLLRLIEFLMRCFKHLLELISYLRMSTLSMGCFRFHQITTLGVPTSKVRYLKRSIKTRWNSEFQSATSYIRLRPHVEAATRREGYAGPECLTEEEVNILEDYVSLLKPIDDMTNLLSGESYITISLVLPAISLITKQTESVSPKTAVGAELKIALLDELKLCLDKHLKSNHHAIATLLDPRFKRAGFSMTQSASLVDSINSEMKTVTPASQTFVPVDSAFYPEYEDILQNEQELNDNTGMYHKELKNYLNMIPSVIRADPLQFWLQNRPKFPTLSRIALKYLLVPASSAASERIVSCLNLVLDKKRNRLSDENVDNLVFLHGLDLSVWKKVLNFHQ